MGSEDLEPGGMGPLTVDFLRIVSIRRHVVPLSVRCTSGRPPRPASHSCPLCSLLLDFHKGSATTAITTTLIITRLLTHMCALLHC